MGKCPIAYASASLNESVSAHTLSASFYSFLSRFRRADPVCKGLASINNNRWALNIVKRYGIRVRKKVTGKSFLALVPYAHLMRHKRESMCVSNNSKCPHKQEVELEYSMDNMVRLKVKRGSSLQAGDEFRVDHSNIMMTNISYSDVDTMIRFHHVSASSDPNPNNFIRIVLPGCRDPNDDLYSHVDHMDEWRKMLHFPLKLRELYEASQQLMLYGEEWVRVQKSKAWLCNRIPINLQNLIFPFILAAVGRGRATRYRKGK